MQRFRNTRILLAKQTNRVIRWYSAHEFQGSHCLQLMQQLCSASKYSRAGHHSDHCAGDDGEENEQVDSAGRGDVDGVFGHFDFSAVVMYGDNGFLAILDIPQEVNWC